MPELPEVEQFRRLLLPLVSKKYTLKIELHNENTAKKFLTPQEIESLSGNCYCTDVIRKGKQICLALERVKHSTPLYLFIHMGMTGHITSPNKFCKWGHEGIDVNEDDFPPRFTYLTFTCGDYVAAFSDPRKFGKTYLADNLEDLSLLAPDALDVKDPKTIQDIIDRLTNAPQSIKALLLDQKKIFCGVGNWVADEVLYQCKIHPDQQYLTEEQAKHLFTKLQEILQVAVDCLDEDKPYPSDWLFGYRWTKKKAGKDHAGRSLTFLTSGGRTSAIVVSIQKLYKSQGKAKSPAPKAAKPKAKTPTKVPKEAVTEVKIEKKTVKRKVTDTSSSTSSSSSGSKRRRSARFVSP